MKNLIGKVVKVAVCDFGTGLCEVLGVTDEKVVLQWITFSACYSCQTYSETMYTDAQTIECTDIAEVGSVVPMTEAEIFSKRQESICMDEPIFERYYTQEKVLLKCTCNTGDAVLRFVFRGDFVENTCCELENVCIEESGQPYEPVGTKWTGGKFTSVAAAMDVVNRYCRQEEGVFDIIYICEPLKQFVEKHRGNVVLSVNDKPVYEKIIHGDWYDDYELMLVTDRFIYYGEEDMFVMLDAENRSIVSDNYFAECGLWDSLENIGNGTETCLWKMEGLGVEV